VEIEESPAPFLNCGEGSSLDSLTKQTKMTRYEICISIFALWVHLIGGQEKFFLHTVMNARTARFHGVFGLGWNRVLCPFQFSSDWSVKEYLGNCSRKIRAVKTNSHFQYMFLARRLSFSDERILDFEFHPLDEKEEDVLDSWAPESHVSIREEGNQLFHQTSIHISAGCRWMKFAVTVSVNDVPAAAQDFWAASLCALLRRLTARAGQLQETLHEIRCELCEELGLSRDEVVTFPPSDRRDADPSE